VSPEASVTVIGKQEKPTGVVVEVVVSVSVIDVVMVASTDVVSVSRHAVARAARVTTAVANLGDAEAVAVESSVKPQSEPSISVDLAELVVLSGKQVNWDADVASVNFVTVMVRYSVDVNVSLSVLAQVFASQKPPALQHP
jgi:hypothetical protein